MSKYTRYNIPDSQAEMIARLEEKYAHLGLRFDTGFVGSIPVQATGRIGRRFIYFRFRSDTASLRIGSPTRRNDSGRERRAARKARRQLRRGGLEGLDRFFVEHQMRPDIWGREFPSHVVRYAAIHDVTGDPYNGSLEDNEAEELFVRLMDQLEAAPRETDRRWYYGRYWHRGYTMPVANGHGVIRKNL